MSGVEGMIVDAFNVLDATVLTAMGALDFDGSAIAQAWWTVLRWATIYAAIAIFISSSDDLFLDICFWLYRAQSTVVAIFRRPPTTRDLLTRPQKRIAVIVPAWNEADVIAEMLRTNLKRLDYDAYDIFVGVYQNDPDTRREVDAVAQTDPRVIRAIVRSNGPSSKADALNWIIHAVRAREEGTGELYDFIVMQDAEDVIHPMTLRTFNWHLDTADMVQLPVLSMPRKWHRLVAGHYMDEFAEWHTKDLVARSWMSGIVPSAGVATGFTRKAIETLLVENDGGAFNTSSLTEDYDIGQRLRRHGLHGRFVRQYVDRSDGERGRELVTTREFFPDKLQQSVRQKARWVLGISLLGWRDLGWFGSFADRYFLYRDRKALWTAPTGMLAYAIIFQVLLYELVVLVAPQVGRLPPLIEQDSWVWSLILINFFFLLNRVIHRVIFTAYAHGWVAALISPARLPITNYISFLAVWRACRQFLVHLVSGKTLTWDKTDHSYPSAKEIDAVFTRGPALTLSANPGSGSLQPIRFDATRLDPELLDPELPTGRDDVIAIGPVAGALWLAVGERDDPSSSVRVVPADQEDLALARALRDAPDHLAKAQGVLRELDGVTRYARVREALKYHADGKIDLAAWAASLDIESQNGPQHENDTSNGRQKEGQ